VKTSHFDIQTLVAKEGVIALRDHPDLVGPIRWHGLCESLGGDGIAERPAEVMAMVRQALEMLGTA
jgi:hypothetical protein